MKGETVLCPPTPSWRRRSAALHAGARVEFVDCNREDLCMSFEDFEAQGRSEHKPKAAILVHIGGHIAFDSQRIADTAARPTGIFLVEDCAHAHGAEWNGRARALRRRRRLLVLRDQDGLDRRGRRARLAPTELIEYASSSATTASRSTRSPGSTSA